MYDRVASQNVQINCLKSALNIWYPEVWPVSALCAFQYFQVVGVRFTYHRKQMKNTEAFLSSLGAELQVCHTLLPFELQNVPNNVKVTPLTPAGTLY